MKTEIELKLTTQKKKILISLAILFMVIVFGGLSYALSIYLSFNPDDLSFLSSQNVDSINTNQIKYTKIALAKVPTSCKDAFTSTEDKTFYSNIGIDLNGLARLFLTGLTNKTDSGGSTISQQVIKLSNQSIYNRGAFDKVIEIIEAVKLNQVWSKDKILETYLNNIYMGNYNYGIESAAQDYFAKSTAKLDLAECSFLAGLPQAPEVYNPHKNLTLGLARQKIVLNLMLKNQKITQSEFDSASKEILKFTN